MVDCYLTPLMGFGQTGLPGKTGTGEVTVSPSEPLPVHTRTSFKQPPRPLDKFITSSLFEDVGIR
jgi:hypothetical protein